MRPHVETIPYSRLSRRFARFFVAWRDGDPRAAEFLPSAPSDPHAFKVAAESRAGGRYPRMDLADALSARHRELGSPPPVLASIEALRCPDTLCVLAGQQPLLAGGPLFVAFKAMTALALARDLEGRLGVRCIPLFWNHSDDHDIAEVDCLGVPDGEGRCRFIRAGFPADRRPIRDLEDDARLAEVRAALVAVLPETPHRDAVIQLVNSTRDARPAGWFTRILTRWFGEEGLVVFEPGWFARQSAPVLARALESPGLVAEAVDSGGRALAAAGFPRLLPDPGAGIFLHEGGGRCRVEWTGDRLAWPGGEEALPAMLRRLADRPSDFSPGAALRPVVQDALFPSVATVAGPNEASYLAQLGPLYRRLGTVPAPVVPRISATILGPSIADAMEACHVSCETVLRGESFAPPLPDALGKCFAEARREVEAALDRLGRATVGWGAGLALNHGKTRERVLESIDIYARKVATASRRGGGDRCVEAIRSHLTPDGRMQEQVLSGLWLLAHLGVDGFAGLADVLDYRAAGHQVVSVRT